MKQEEKKVVGTIDCTPTWSSLVHWFIAILEDGTATEKAKEGIRKSILQMAQVADSYVDYLKEQEKQKQEIGNCIVEAARPKFCMETSVILGAKVKLTRFEGTDKIFNGLIGKTYHRFVDEPNNTKGYVGIMFYPNQIVMDGKKTTAASFMNVHSDNLFFID